MGPPHNEVNDLVPRQCQSGFIQRVSDFEFAMYFGMYDHAFVRITASNGFDVG